MSKKNRGSAKEPDAAAAAGRGEPIRVALTPAVSLPFGFACAVFRAGRLHAVEWEPTMPGLEAVVARKFPGSRPGSAHGSRPGEVLRAYAAGAAVRPEDILALPFEWERLRTFSRIALRELANVPYGALLTYGELAARCGNPNAARAVGSALARNPWPVLIPCHRVVGAGGGMVGFGKGTEAKEALLRFERRTRESEGAA